MQHALRRHRHANRPIIACVGTARIGAAVHVSQAVFHGPSAGRVAVHVSQDAEPTLEKADRKSAVQHAAWDAIPAQPSALAHDGSPAPSEGSPQTQTSQTPADDSDEALVFDIPEHVLQRNRAFAGRIQGRLILAPLTRGGNLPFRQLCANLGCEVTMSEMAFARNLIKGDRVERARLYKGANEDCYGFQVATKVISEGVEAARMAQEAGAAWLDINVGCPIYEASRRGVGAIMLRKPRSLARFVHGVVLGSALPVTVKIRTGESDRKINVARVVELLRRAGAAAITVHGRTMEQRYRKPADWSLIASAAAASQPDVPIIGNGDVLTHYDVKRRFEESGVHAVMSGRGALIRPWIFQEFKEGRELSLTASDRVGVYRQLVTLMKAHFGDDDLGRRKAMYFFPWHFSFFHRYRSFPEPVYGAASRERPLICTRVDKCDPLLGEALDTLDPLERLLRCESEDAHKAIAAVLWDSPSDAEAMDSLRRLAGESLMGWEADVGRAGPLDPSRGGGIGSGGGKERGRRQEEEEY